MNKIIYFVTVNFFSVDNIKKYIASIYDLDHVQDYFYKIIIIDNSMNEYEYIKLCKLCDTLDDVVLIKNNINEGYFRGLNKGIEYIQEILYKKLNSYYFFVVSNNDIVFKKDFAVRLIEKDIDKSVFVISPNIITNDGYHQNPQLLKDMSLFKKIILSMLSINYTLAIVMVKLLIIFRKKKRDNKYWKIQQEIYQGNGSCYVLTINFFKIYEKLDDRVFMWYEEFFLARQVKKASGVLMYFPDIVVYHDTNLDDTLYHSLKNKKLFKIRQDSTKKYLKSWLFDL